jgi:hypothetical protein
MLSLLTSVQDEAITFLMVSNLKRAGLPDQQQ